MTHEPPFVVLDRYLVESEIGRGGNAIVYRAFDPQLKVSVAVKVIRDDVFSATSVARFQQEVQLTSHLNHDNILRVLDTGEIEGRPLVVMQLADGQSLGHRLAAEGLLPIWDALSIARDVGRALAHAHENNVVHRDVKPENILLDRTGRAFLSDFGIARFTSEHLATRLTSTGVAVGTVLYMSPEQLCAERTIDARSDQYSLACVLYEMLAGVRPHIAATFEGLRALRTVGRHTNVASHRALVPKYVAEAIQTALAPAPADRFRNLEEFIAALDLGTHERVGRSPDKASLSDLTTTRQPVLRRGRTLGYAAIALLIVTAGVAVRRWTGTPSAADERSVRIAVVNGQQVTAGNDVASEVIDDIKSELGAWSAVRLIERDGAEATVDIRAQVSAIEVGDSLQVTLESKGQDGSSGQRIVRRFGYKSADERRSNIARIVRILLAGPNAELANGLDELPDRSLVALRSYARAFSELNVGRLDSASVTFLAASIASPKFTKASFWAAQTASWMSPRNSTGWKALARSAIPSDDRNAPDSVLAVALLAMADHDYPRACRLYRSGGSVGLLEFVRLYGLAECQRLDESVLHDQGGNLKFRTSHWSALASYRDAIGNISPKIFVPQLARRLIQLTYAESGRMRVGFDSASGIPYSALPSLINDTIAFVPIAQTSFRATGNGAVPTSWVAALRSGRAIADQITAVWVKELPMSGAAWLSRATALELSGQLEPRLDRRSASESLDSAQKYSSTVDELAEIGVARVRLSLRQSDVAQAIELSRRSLAAARTDRPDAAAKLAPLAALLGDFAMVEKLATPAMEHDSSIPGDLSDSINVFELRSSVGNCVATENSFRSFNEFFDAKFPVSSRIQERRRLLLSAYRNAVPCLSSEIMTQFPAEVPIDGAFQAIARKDFAEARRILRTVRASRAGALEALVTWDYLYLESWALVAAGDTLQAREQILNALGEISGMSMYTLDQASQAAGLRRAIGLLAAIGARPPLSDVERAWVAKEKLLPHKPLLEAKK